MTLAQQASQLAAGFYVSLSGNNKHKRMENELADFQKELAQLQAVCQRMQGAFGKGGVAEVAKELPAMQGWTLSLVETFFSIVWGTSSLAEMSAVKKEWHKMI